MTQKKPSRTSDFLWHSKQELYSYFSEKHDLSPKEIDTEIERVMEGFRLRQGQSIKTQELWQKVGLNLAEQHGDKEVLAKWEEILEERKAHPPIPAALRETQKIDVEDDGQTSNDSDSADDDTAFFEVNI